MSKIFTLSTLSSHGRLGNNLFAYCFAKGIAKHYGWELHIPVDWFGRKIFNITDPILEFMPKVQTPLDYIPTQADVDQYDHIDLFGYWQFQDAIDFYSKSDAKEYLQFHDWIVKEFPKGWCKPELSDGTYTAVHKRRGDYITTHANYYCSVSDNSYASVLKKLGKCPLDVVNFSEENPFQNQYCIYQDLAFLPDFVGMTQSDILVRANSSMSWWASVLGNAKTYSPVVEDKVGWNDVTFVEGNWPKMASSKIHTMSKLTDLYLKD